MAAARLDSRTRAVQDSPWKWRSVRTVQAEASELLNHHESCSRLYPMMDHDDDPPGGVS